jgi:hypothetical protein
LAKKFPGRKKLRAHLLSLKKADLAAIILSETDNPSTSSAGDSRFTHCVYCHQIFDTEDNDDGRQVEHYGDRSDADDPDYPVFFCCEKEMSVVHYDPKCHAPPEDQEPWCYEGPHWEREIESDDEEPGVWWKDWMEDSGMTCKEKGCKGLAKQGKKKSRR